jgi:hypothetical protein
MLRRLSSPEMRANLKEYTSKLEALSMARTFCTKSSSEVPGIDGFQCDFHVSRFGSHSLPVTSFSRES